MRIKPPYGTITLGAHFLLRSPPSGTDFIGPNRSHYYMKNVNSLEAFHKNVSKPVTCNDKTIESVRSIPQKQLQRTIIKTNFGRHLASFGAIWPCVFDRTGACKRSSKVKLPRRRARPSRFPRYLPIRLPPGGPKDRPQQHAAK